MQLKIRQYGTQRDRWLLVVVLLLLLCPPVEAQRISYQEFSEGIPSAEVYSIITDFERRSLEAFTERDLIFLDSALLQPDVPYRGRFFLLAGWLGRSQTLEAVPFEYRQTTRLKNDYDLALIRIGDEPRIQRLERLLREAYVNDDFIYDIAPQLIYTRRQEVFDFFLDQILLNQQNCSPGDSHTSGQINCAYRLLELVAPHIQDFPLKVGTSGDLEVEDYVAALSLARIWINENRADYRIITETY